MSPTESVVRRKAAGLGVPAELMCMVCARVAYEREHYGHTVVRVPRPPAPTPAPVPTPRERISVLTVQDIAGELGVSKMTVYRLIHGGVLPHLRIGRSMRVRESDFRKFVAGAEVQIVGEA